MASARVIWSLVAVVIGVVLWGGSTEAANCGPTVGACQCGDTLVEDMALGSAVTYQCPHVDQGLTLADGVYLDCAGSKVVGNGVGGSAGFRLGNGSIAVWCRTEGFQYGFTFEGWYATLYANTVVSSTDEGVHFKPGTGGNTIHWCEINAPVEAVYLYSTYGNEIANSVLTGGSNAVYVKGGSSSNYVHDNALNGGVNRLNQVGAGADNYYVDNDAHGGTLRSSGSSPYSYIHNNHEGSVNNVDGALYAY